MWHHPSRLCWHSLWNVTLFFLKPILFSQKKPPFIQISSQLLYYVKNNKFMGRWVGQWLQQAPHILQQLQVRLLACNLLLCVFSTVSLPSFPVSTPPIKATKRLKDNKITDFLILKALVKLETAIVATEQWKYDEIRWTWRHWMLGPKSRVSGNYWTLPLVSGKKVLCSKHS